MYEYEKNIINNTNEYLDKIDMIENYSCSTNHMRKICHELIQEDVYNTTKIEGNSLNETEANYFLVNDVTIRGKSLRDFIQLRNQKKVNTQILEDLLHNPDKLQLSIETILKIHRVITYGELEDEECGHFRNDYVTLATTITIPPDWNDIPYFMNELIEKYYAPLGIGETQFERICEFKRNFERIHPFFDGNGRTGRVLMNMLFIQNGYPVITIPYEKRLEYFDSLEDNTFSDFCASLMLESIHRIQELELISEQAKDEL